MRPGGQLWPPQPRAGPGHFAATVCALLAQRWNVPGHGVFHLGIQMRVKQKGADSKSCSWSRRPKMRSAQHWLQRGSPSVLPDTGRCPLQEPRWQQSKQVQVCHLFVVFIIFDLAF